MPLINFGFGFYLKLLCINVVRVIIEMNFLIGILIEVRLPLAMKIIFSTIACTKTFPKLKQSILFEKKKNK